MSVATFLDAVVATDSGLDAREYHHVPHGPTAVDPQILVDPQCRLAALDLAYAHELRVNLDSRWSVGLTDGTGESITLRPAVVPARAYATAGAGLLLALDGWIQSGEPLDWFPLPGGPTVADIVREADMSDAEHPLHRTASSAIGRLLHGTQPSAWDVMLLRYLPGVFIPPIPAYGTDIPVVSNVHETLTTLLTDHLADVAWGDFYGAALAAGRIVTAHAHLIETAHALTPGVAPRSVVTARPPLPGNARPEWWASA